MFTINMTGVAVMLQLGFFGIVGIPLFKAITDLFKDAQPMMDGKPDCLATLLTYFSARLSKCLCPLIMPLLLSELQLHMHFLPKHDLLLIVFGYADYTRCTCNAAGVLANLRMWEADAKAST